MNQKTVVICVALDGYQYFYSPLIESQRAYAMRFGYDFWLIKKPMLSGIGNECAWLKLYLMQKALEKGYDLVLSIDADAEIKEAAPALERLLQSEKNIYMAKGFSGRFNSGVILLRKSRGAIEFIEQVIWLADKPLDEDCVVGWGENGQVIQVAKNNQSVCEISQVWNNNFNFELTDYIRHYSKGPLYALYKPIVKNYIKFLCVSVAAKIYRRLLKVKGVFGVREQHQFLLRKVNSYYFKC